MISVCTYVNICTNFHCLMLIKIYVEIYRKLESCLDSVSAKYWLYVLPQLIARINDSRFSDLLLQVLLKVCSTCPQALVCPISGTSPTYSIY